MTTTKPTILACDWCNGYLARSGNIVNDGQLAANFDTRESADRAALASGWRTAADGLNGRKIHVCKNCLRDPQRQSVRPTVLAGGNA